MRRGLPLCHALCPFSTGREVTRLLRIRTVYERTGLGSREVLDHLARQARLAKRRGCLEWWVLDWNEPAIGFYRAVGAEPMDDWTVYRVSGAALEDLATGA